MIKPLLVRAAPAIFLLLWSGGFTVAKIGISDADPITLLALRYFCVIVLLLPFLFVFRPPLPTTLLEWLHLILVGFLIQVVYFGTAWIAFSLGGSAATVALITSMQPILVALIVPSISNEIVSTKRWFGLLLGLLGAIMVIIGNSGLLSLTQNGQARYELKTPYRDGTTHVIFDPLDFIARLVALIPKPRVNLARYHGVLFRASCPAPLRGQPAAVQIRSRRFCRTEQPLG